MSSSSESSKVLHPHEADGEGASGLAEHGLKPMEAAVALYSERDSEVAAAIVASLSREIFDRDLPKAASRIKRRLAGLTYRILKRTTKEHVRTDPDGTEYVAYKNRILERSGHPYAMTLLEPSGADSASFVEGGDPMNAPYMMISPEINQHAELWDKLLLGSVHGTDVQLRFMRETQFTHKVARERLERGEPVRLKALAAGTGLSMILVYDRLVREGFDPKMITTTITDRDPANVDRSLRLMRQLTTTRDNIATGADIHGISARVEDLLHPAPEDTDDRHDIVTLVGILEYFAGHTSASTHEHLGHDLPESEIDAVHIIDKINPMLNESGTLIANSYRVETGARILEIFGKKLFYRDRAKLQSLVETAGFTSRGIAGSGHVYDVEVFGKSKA